MSLHNRKELWDKIDNMIDAVELIKDEVRRYRDVEPIKHMIESLEQLTTEAKKCVEELKEDERASGDVGLVKRLVER